MLGLVYIANDVEIANSVLAGAIVPSFFFGVVWSILKPLQLVLEVQNVVGLFVPKRFVLVLGQDFDGVPLLDVSDLLLALWVGESLSDWVVLDFLGLHVRISYLAVRFRHLLEILLLFLVVIDLSAPCIIAINHACGPVGLS